MLNSKPQPFSSSCSGCCRIIFVSPSIHLTAIIKDYGGSLLSDLGKAYPSKLTRAQYEFIGDLIPEPKADVEI
ncbi:hypothetical protein LC605_11520 [Nostoc sp. CHAB 5836]|uniref:hypothetical protein n=1 Tax=Nostoc sp. CHAB 5836 TaxID=2780404 RepID=UPI001E3EAAAB|nr:hypothetical protein [Nostoc sp. CHAB 5836]MCC5615690.1 hypothetical protein [Nostoc sp. CHAB 5836]